MVHSRYFLVPKSKLFSFIPLVCMVCFSLSSFSQKFEKSGNIVTYRGNKFEYLPDGVPDTQMVKDPVSGKEVTRVTTKDPIPVKMNGARIYNTDEITLKPSPVGDNPSLELYIFKGLSTDLNKLPDGNYYLYVSNVIIDNKGKVVYYEYDGISSERNKTKIPADVKKAIASKIDPLINKAAAFKPGKVNGYAVIVRSDIMLSMFTIVVKKHKAAFTRGF